MPWHVGSYRPGERLSPRRASQSLETAEASPAGSVSPANRAIQSTHASAPYVTLSHQVNNPPPESTQAPDNWGRPLHIKPTGIIPKAHPKLFTLPSLAFPTETPIKALASAFPLLLSAASQAWVLPCGPVGWATTGNIKLFFRWC